MEDIIFMVDAEYGAAAIVGGNDPALFLPKEILWQVAFNLSPEKPVCVRFVVREADLKREDIRAWALRLTAMKLPNAELITVLSPSSPSVG